MTTNSLENEKFARPQSHALNRPTPKKATNHRQRPDTKADLTE